MFSLTIQALGHNFFEGAVLRVICGVQLLCSCEIITAYVQLIFFVIHFVSRFFLSMGNIVFYISLKIMLCTVQNYTAQHIYSYVISIL